MTAAGDGTAGYTGDDGPATAAELNCPVGVAVDSAGDLFIADYGNNVVREVVKATGDIITVAGNGTAGYSGDGGPATAAELNGPRDVAVDSAGDLFIADTNNNVVREVVTATGDIITVAGDGKAATAATAGPRPPPSWTAPRGLAVDSAGDLFIADTGNNVIREVVKATGDIITVAGNGKAGYSGDGGPATAAELNNPNDVAVDAAGDLFIADENNNAVREVVKATGDIITVAGNGTAGYSGDGGPATAAELNNPTGVAFDSAGDLFIADGGNNVVREVVKATGDIITVAGDGTAGYSGDNGPATAAELDGRLRVAVDPAGDVFVADLDNNVVREFTPAVTVTISPTPTPTPTTTPTPTPTTTPTPTPTPTTTPKPSPIFISGSGGAGSFTPMPVLIAPFRDPDDPRGADEIPEIWPAGLPRCHSQACRGPARGALRLRQFPGWHDRAGYGPVEPRHGQARDFGTRAGAQPDPGPLQLGAGHGPQHGDHHRDRPAATLEEQGPLHRGGDEEGP